MADLQAESTLNVDVQGEQAVQRLAAAFQNLQQQATNVQRAVSAAGGAASAAALQNQVETFNRRASQQADQLGASIGSTIGNAINRTLRGPISTVARAVSAVTGGLGGITGGLSATTVAMIGLGAAVTGLAVPLINLIGGFKMLRTSFNWAQEAAQEQIRVSARTRRFYPQLMGEALEAAEGEMRVRMNAASALFGEGADQMQEALTRRMSAFRLGRGIRGERDIFARWGITQDTIRQFEAGGRRLDVMGWLEQFVLKREDLDRRLEQATTPQEQAVLTRKLSLLADDTTKIFGQRFADMVLVQRSGTLRQLNANLRRALPLGESANAKQNAIDFNVALKSLQGTLWSIALGVGGDVTPSITASMIELNRKLLDTKEGGEGLGRSLRELGSSMANTAWKALREVMERIKPETINDWIKQITDWNPGPTIDNIGKVFTAIFEIGKAIGTVISAFDKVAEILKPFTSYLMRGWGHKEEEKTEAATTEGPAARAEAGLEAARGLLAQSAGPPTTPSIGPGETVITPTFGPPEATPPVGARSQAVAAQAANVAAQAAEVATQAQAVAAQAAPTEALAPEAALTPAVPASAPTAPLEPGAYHWTEPTPAAVTAAPPAYAWPAAIQPGELAAPVAAAPAQAVPTAAPWFEAAAPAYAAPAAAQPAEPAAPPAYAWPAQAAEPIAPAAAAPAVPTAAPWIEGGPAFTAAAAQAAEPPAPTPAAPGPAATPAYAWEDRPTAAAAAPAPAPPSIPDLGYAWEARPEAVAATAAPAPVAAAAGPIEPIPAAFAWAEQPVVAATGATEPEAPAATAWTGPQAAAPGPPPEEPTIPAAVPWGATPAAPNRYGRPLPDDGAAQQALKSAAAGSALATMTDIEREPSGDQLVMKTTATSPAPSSAATWGLWGAGAALEWAGLLPGGGSFGLGAGRALTVGGAPDVKTKAIATGAYVLGGGPLSALAQAQQDPQQAYEIERLRAKAWGDESFARFGLGTPRTPFEETFTPFAKEALTEPAPEREGEWGGITTQDGANFGAAAADSLRENLRGYAIPQGTATTSYGVAPRSAPKPTGGDTATEA